ncbi:MAG: RluA family pseudouridine synthase [Chlamydiota bacterium]|nr:RluA family pseudouridine synthase [Chlamydiota bacterium]
MTEDKWTVEASESGQRLQSYIQHKMDGRFSAKKIKSAIESNACRVNGVKERFSSYRVRTGDRIIFSRHALQVKCVKSEVFVKDRVLFEDDSILVYHKPYGVVSDHDGLFDILRKKYPSLCMVHRLDKDTSGAIIYAKSSKAQKALIELFREKKVRKEYLAIVSRIPKADCGIIDQPIGKIHEYQGQSLWGIVSLKKGGDSARTEWKVLKKGAGASLISCAPITGRTHQIRVHLSSMGHPLIGDKQYGREVDEVYSASRHLLHAYKLTFPHPLAKSIVSVECSPPEDFLAAMRKLFDSGEYV